MEILVSLGILAFIGFYYYSSFAGAYYAAKASRPWVALACVLIPLFGMCYFLMRPKVSNFTAQKQVD